MLVPKLEKFLGIEVYATSSFGIGGVIRQQVEDFVVEEVLVDGSKAEVSLSENYPRHRSLGISTSENQYLVCVLVKQNWDAFLAIKSITKQLGVSTKAIHFAGIKDARAITAQHITIENVSAEEIQKVRVKDIEIRPLGYFHSKISSYYLMANHFKIAIRAINHTESSVKKRIVQTIKEFEVAGGAPNFFGHQRFGTKRPITHLVGRALVQRDIRKAAMLFLTEPSLHEHPESRWAREQLRKTQDFKQALKNFPKKLSFERLMLKRLAENPCDFIGAFRNLPAGLRRLLPQAYQACLFNRFLSRRIKEELPLNKASVGDYVLNVERSGLPMLKMHNMADHKKIKEMNKSTQAGRMRVALPLVGFKQHASKGFQGEIEKQVLDEEGISPEDFRIQAMPEISLRGSLRPALVLIEDFLLDEISEDSVNPLKRKAEISFTLKRGSYATTILRELMKPHNLIKAGF